MCTLRDYVCIERQATSGVDCRLDVRERSSCGRLRFRGTFRGFQRIYVTSLAERANAEIPGCPRCGGTQSRRRPIWDQCTTKAISIFISVERFCESHTLDTGFTQPFDSIKAGSVGVIPNPCVAHGESTLSIPKWVCVLQQESPFFEKLQQKESFVFHRGWRGRREGRANKQSEKGERKSRIFQQICILGNIELFV